MALLLAACAGTSGLSRANPIEHVDSPDSPPHLHLEDGAVVNTDGLFGDTDLLEKLLEGDPITLDPANESAQTVSITIPTMF